MKKLKELMKGYKTRTFGRYKVIKEVAQRYDDNYNEYFFNIYTIEII